MNSNPGMSGFASLADIDPSRERNTAKRTRVLAKTVAMSLKLGELYSNPYIHDPTTAEERLVWAVETILKEKQRRETQGVKENEGAHNYEEKNRHYLATPLFLQALSLKPTEDCHSVVLSQYPI